jgi:DNA-binding LacI/PurR family transcriptional regulator
MKDNSPKHIYVANVVKEDIKRGRITDRLPGERRIAKDLGISYMTVRKAVENLVNEGVLQKIPNKGTYVNKQDNKNKTYNLGFFLDDAIKDSISSPYYSLVFDELERAAVKRGYSLMFFSNYDDLSSLKSIKKVDGLIVSFFPRIENKIHGILVSIPLVVIGNGSSDKSIPSVILDNFNGVISAMDYLFSLGHKRVGFISGLLDSDIGVHRLNGYKTALSKHGIHEDQDLIYVSDYSYNGGVMGAKKLLSLSNRPTAIVCSNDTMAMGAIKTACEQGLTIPEDISITGFDDITVASQIHPALTTVAAPIKQIAERSVETLILLIEDKAPENIHIALPTQLIIRDSCAPAKMNN